MSHVFGPVPSRRLGMSLGVDLIPAKTCSFDCLYCQVGKTTARTIKREPFVPVQAVVAEIREALLKSSPDAITLAGSGEPTLHSQIDQVIFSIKDVTDVKVALLTNGALFWIEEVRRSVLGVDIVMPTLSSAFEATFKKIHRPHPALELKRVVDGMRLFREQYKGDLFMEVVLLAGINDTEREIKGLKALMAQIAPDRIQLNTVVRPPADRRARSLDSKRLMEIKEIFGGNAEIVADIPVLCGSGRKDSTTRTLLDMVRRRPLRPLDIARSLDLPVGDVEELVKGLLIKGLIREQEHSGDTYYLSHETEVQ